MSAADSEGVEASLLSQHHAASDNTNFAGATPSIPLAQTYSQWRNPLADPAPYAALPTPSNELIRLQAFLDGGYPLATAVQLANTNPSEFPAPPVKSRTHAELLAALNATSAAVAANGLTLYSHAPGAISSSAQASGPPSFASLPIDNNSRVVVEVRQAGPRCSYGACQNIAISTCEYNAENSALSYCAGGDCTTLVCVMHGKRVVLGRVVRVVCPDHAAEVARCKYISMVIALLVFIGFTVGLLYAF